MMSYAVARIPASDPTPPQASRSRLRRRVLAWVLAFRRGVCERARTRRRARMTAAALERLGPRDLRDIGLVRFDDVHGTRRVRNLDRG